MWSQQALSANIWNSPLWLIRLMISHLRLSTLWIKGSKCLKKVPSQWILWETLSFQSTQLTSSLSTKVLHSLSKSLVNRITTFCSTVMKKILFLVTIISKSPLKLRASTLMGWEKDSPKSSDFLTVNGLSSTETEARLSIKDKESKHMDIILFIYNVKTIINSTLIISDLPMLWMWSDKQRMGKFSWPTKWLEVFLTSDFS